MWITIDYEPVSAFGLRPSNTTSSGGKSLLIPTPYAIKMALLDRMIRYGGINYGVEMFPAVRDLEIHIQVPFVVAVNRTFQKVLRPSGKEKYWNETIAQREYCIHAGVMRLAFFTEHSTLSDELPQIASSINYFGRKGGFFQFTNWTSDITPDAQFVNLCKPADMSQLSNIGFLQRMDDMRPGTTFKEISTFCKKGRNDDGGRISYTIILPYKLVSHGFNHSIYATNEVTS